MCEVICMNASLWLQECDVGLGLCVCGNEDLGLNPRPTVYKRGGLINLSLCMLVFPPVKQE